MALFDTGAQTTLVSPKIIETLEFVPIAPALIGTVGGNTVETKAYWMDIGIPVQIGDNEIFGTSRSMKVASLLFQPANFDVLVGMDFIAAYHITLFSNRIVISN